MTAIDQLLDRLFDYAGLYPPASLDLPRAVANDAAYRQGRNAHALGRFVVDLNRVDALERVAGDYFSRMKLSVVAAANADWKTLVRLLGAGAGIESAELKVTVPADVEEVAGQLPEGLTTYFEVPIDRDSMQILDAVCRAGAGLKLRMGGVVAEAFPSSHAVAGMLSAIADRHLIFKATAGLHHPLRSRHPLTYAPDSHEGMMHGFVNLFCAAALIYFDGDPGDAIAILEETNPEAWSVTSDAVAWRDLKWSADEIRAVRQRFFASIGSCSITEPMADVEMLGWR
jgi:hypothetical protein